MGNVSILLVGGIASINQSKSTAIFKTIINARGANVSLALFDLSTSRTLGRRW